MNKKDLDGKTLAKKIKSDLKESAKIFLQEFGRKPTLGVVVVGEDPSAITYIKSKQRTCKRIGIDCYLKNLPESASLTDLEKAICQMNDDPNIDGIILEMPLPPHIPYYKAVSLIDPNKDVDGLHPLNLGLLFSDKPHFVPSTPLAVMKIIEEYSIPLKGKNVTIVGRSMAVGKPLYALMLSKNATVTTCHSKTTDLTHHTHQADVLVVSVGKPRLITKEMVKEGAVVIDVGINVTDEGLVGDVDYKNIYDKVSWITPVPGGVGPLTVSMILYNTLKAADERERKGNSSIHRVK